MDFTGEKVLGKGIQSEVLAEVAVNVLYELAGDVLGAAALGEGAVDLGAEALVDFKKHRAEAGDGQHALLLLAGRPAL